LPGEIASNPAVGPGGDIVIGAVSDRGAVLRRYLADGTQRWELTQTGIQAGSPVAIDANGDVLYATGNAVVKLDRDGQQLWRVRVDGDDVVTTAIAAVGDATVVRGRAKSGPFLAALSSSGAVQWVRALPGDADSGASLLAMDGDGRSVVVTAADGCGASVAAFDAGGAPRWSRPLARAGCDGGQLTVHGIAVAPEGRVLTGGALTAAADFGVGPVHVQATDAFLVALTP
jgi:outer membrane protein assembly factor BamB